MKDGITSGLTCVFALALLAAAPWQIGLGKWQTGMVEILSVTWS